MNPDRVLTVFSTGRANHIPSLPKSERDARNTEGQTGSPTYSTVHVARQFPILVAHAQGTIPGSVHDLTMT